MSYSIQWSENGVLIQFSGEVVYCDILDASDEFYGDPRCATIDYQILDFQAVASTDLLESMRADLHDLQVVLQASIAKRQKIALIAAREDVRAGWEKYAALIASKTKTTRVFGTRSEAEAWARAPFDAADDDTLYRSAT